MSLATFVYRLKAEAGDTTPHDELATAGDLSGGTISLVDDGAGGKTWRFVGVASATGPSKTVDIYGGTYDASGATVAVRVRIISAGSTTSESYAAWAKSGLSGGLGFSRGTGTSVIRGFYESSPQNNITHAGAWLTAVVRIKEGNAAVDTVSGWWSGGSGHPTADFTNTGNYANATLGAIVAGSATGTIEISDLVFWGEELSDADCATLVDSGIRTTLDGAGDTTAPILSSPVGTTTGSTTATVGATTDEGNGTLYAVVATSATQPSVAQIKAGQDHAGSAAPWSGSVAVASTGAKTLGATGLTASTTYYAHLVHTDAAANDSNRVVSASFTTDASNPAPVWSGTPSAMSTKRGQAVTTQDITSLVSDADTLTYSLTGAPTGITINSSAGVISGTPTAAPGTYSTTVEADDGVNSPVSSPAFNITVTQCLLALNSAGYEFADGNSAATTALVTSTELQVAVYPLTEWPPSTVIATATATTASTGRLADLGDNDLSYGTTYRLLARDAATNETWAWSMTAT
jgi:hypothetical protein